MTSNVAIPQDRVMLPLRAFLGVTFCFAGLQKLASRGFFTASDPASIQAQLAASARRSPIHPLLTPLTHIAVAVGLLIALGELAVGVGTLLGLWSRLAAIGGMVLSFLLFLTVSFHTSPYYTGADIVFLFAWTPLALGVPGPYSLDAMLAARAARAATPVPQARPARGRSPARPVPQAPPRREVMAKGIVTAAVAAGTLVTGGLVAAIGRLVTGRASTSAGPGALATSSAPPQPAPSSSSTASGSSTGKLIGNGHSVPVGQAASFTDPATGDPAIVLHPSAGKFLAFDAVCPHAGCTVEYDPSAAQLVCPCHGSQFNATTGAVETGPATTGLNPIRITQGPGEQLFAG